MEKTNGKLITEIDELKTKYSELKARHVKEVNGLKKEIDDLQMKLMFLEGVSNSSVDGFLVVDQYGTKILQNRRTIELWEIPQDMADDPNISNQFSHVKQMIVDPVKFVEEIDYLRAHPEEKSRHELELVNGTILDRYSSPVFGPNGEYYGRIWTFHDITELKKFEKQLIELNKDKDHFISILAHDLRSPFNGMLGFLVLLDKNLETYPKEKILYMVSSIYTLAKKTYDLLEDTLLWANIKSKKLEFHPSLENVTALIEEVIEIMVPSAKLKNISIINHQKDDLRIWTDSYMLKTILRNLVSNSIKFTYGKGEIDIKICCIKNETIFHVIDNGTGIDQDILNKLFHTSTIQSTPGTDKEMGTGLGLLLCKEFVELHGGKIWIESSVGKGTKVNFSIPGKKIN